MFKKIMGSLLAVAMLASMGTTVFAAEKNMDTGAVKSTYTIQPRLMASVNQNNVRIRTGPSTSYTAFGQLQKGDLVFNDSSVNPVTDSTGMVWVYVYSEIHSRSGWVAEQYISYDGM